MVRMIIFSMFIASVSIADCQLNISPSTWTESCWEDRDSISQPNKQAFIDLICAIREREIAAAVTEYSWRYEIGGEGLPEVPTASIISNHIGVYSSGSNTIDSTPFWFVQGGRYVDSESGSVFVSGPRESFRYMVGRVMKISEQYKPIGTNVISWLNSRDASSTWGSWQDVPSWALFKMRETPHQFRYCLPTFEPKKLMDYAGIGNVGIYAEDTAKNLRCVVSGFPAATTNDLILAEWDNIGGAWRQTISPFSIDDAFMKYLELGIYSDPSGASGSVDIDYVRYNTNSILDSAEPIEYSLSEVFETEEDSDSFAVGTTTDKIITEVLNGTVSSNSEAKKIVLKYVNAEMFGGTDYGDWSVTWSELWAMRDVLSVMTDVIVVPTMLINGVPYENLTNGYYNLETNTFLEYGEMPIRRTCEEACPQPPLTAEEKLECYREWRATHCVGYYDVIGCNADLPVISCQDAMGSTWATAWETNGDTVRLDKSAVSGIEYGRWNMSAWQADGIKSYDPRMYHWGMRFINRGWAKKTKGYGVHVGNWNGEPLLYEAYTVFTNFGITAYLATTDFYVPSSSGSTNGRPREDPVAGTGLFANLWSGKASCTNIITVLYDDVEPYTNQNIWIVGDSKTSPQINPLSYMETQMQSGLNASCTTFPVTVQCNTFSTNDLGEWQNFDCDPQIYNFPSAEGSGRVFISAQSWLSFDFNFE